MFLDIKSNVEPNKEFVNFIFNLEKTKKTLNHITPPLSPKIGKVVSSNSEDTSEFSWDESSEIILNGENIQVSVNIQRQNNETSDTESETSEIESETSETDYDEYYLKNDYEKMGDLKKYYKISGEIPIYPVYDVIEYYEDEYNTEIMSRKYVDTGRRLSL